MTTDRLLLPLAALSPYLFAAILRDTRGRGLKPDERFNHFPASPLCGVSWVFEGENHLVSGGKTTPLPRLAFFGPQTAPVSSWNPGEVVAMSLGIYPEAWQALTGQDMGALVNKTLPLEAVASGALLEVFRALQGPEDFAKLQESLRPCWPHRQPLPRALSAWMRRLTLRAGTSDLGRGLRQAQRRIGGWTGQNSRSLALYTRIEALQEHARTNADLADLAQTAGFSDQSHMGRDLKKVTGRSPARLLERMNNDEAFWAYRLLGSGI